MTTTIYGGNIHPINSGEGDDVIDIYTLLITGSRDWEDEEAVYNSIKNVADWCEEEQMELHIVHGGARGADTCADEAAKRLELPCHRYPAPWNRMRRLISHTASRSAGPKRNRVMIERHYIDAAISFHEDLDSSKGTKDMVKLIKKWDHTIEYEHVGN